jgi:large-conductance mechanosensitive channel
MKFCFLNIGGENMVQLNIGTLLSTLINIALIGGVIYLIVRFIKNE